MTFKQHQRDATRATRALHTVRQSLCFVEFYYKLVRGKYTVSYTHGFTATGPCLV